MDGGRVRVTMLSWRNVVPHDFCVKMQGVSETGKLFEEMSAIFEANHALQIFFSIPL